LDKNRGSSPQMGTLCSHLVPLFVYKAFHKEMSHTQGVFSTVLYSLAVYIVSKGPQSMGRCRGCAPPPSGRMCPFSGRKCPFCRRVQFSMFVPLLLETLKRHSFIAQSHKFSPDKKCFFATRKDMESYSQIPGKRILAL
jgi:hypothetical protein